MYATVINEYEGNFGEGRTLGEIVGWVEELPPMPDVITCAIRLLDDPNSSPEEVAEVIALDPASASMILRCANSADSGQQNHPATLEGAILVVGLIRIKTLLLASALKRWNRRFTPIERLVWEKSLGAAFAAHVLCDRLKKKYRDELHMTALLHNLGQIVIVSNKKFGEIYPAVLDRIRTNHENFASAERNVIGFSHPLVGALVAKRWQLPHETCSAILHYADPFEGIDTLQDEKLAVLKLSIIVSLASGIGCPEGYFADIEEMKDLSQALGFGKDTWEEDLEACTVATKERFKAEASIYSA